LTRAVRAAHDPAMHRWFAALLLVAACGGADPVAADDPCHPDPTSHVVEADLEITSSLRGHVVEVAWKDGGGETVRNDDPDAVRVLLRRAFPDADAARAFAGGVVARIDGAVLGELPLAATDCDAAATSARLAPGEMQLTHGTFAIFEVPAADGGFVYSLGTLAATLCARSPRTLDPGRDACLSDRRFIGLALASDHPIDAYEGDRFHPADALALDQGPYVYRYEVELPVDAPVDSLRAEMSFARAGELVGQIDRRDRDRRIPRLHLQLRRRQLRQRRAVGSGGYGASKAPQSAFVPAGDGRGWPSKSSVTMSRPGSACVFATLFVARW
jgi:hypothetical protein